MGKYARTMNIEKTRWFIENKTTGNFVIGNVMVQLSQFFTETVYDNETNAHIRNLQADIRWALWVSVLFNLRESKSEIDSSICVDDEIDIIACLSAISAVIIPELITEKDNYLIDRYRESFARIIFTWQEYADALEKLPTDKEKDHARM